MIHYPGKPFMDIDEVRYLLSCHASKRQNLFDTSYMPTNQHFPKLTDLTEPVIVGTYSLILLKSKRRYIDASHALKITRLGSDLETATCLSRDYLKELYRSPKIRHEQAELIKNQFMPLFVRPCTFDYGYYVDIKSAWWSIMSICGWSVDYWPGKWIYPGRPPKDFPYPLEKLARSSLVSVAQSYLMGVYHPDTGEMKKRPVYNPVLNFGIYALISHVLTGIGIMAASLGAVYVNSDGMIAPDEDKAVQIMKTIDDWGLPYTIKGSGRGWVKAIGCYRVGDLTTRRNDLIPHPLSKFTIQPSYIAWLYPRWKKIVDRERAENG